MSDDIPRASVGVFVCLDVRLLIPLLVGDLIIPKRGVLGCDGLLVVVIRLSVPGTALDWGVYRVRLLRAPGQFFDRGGGRLSRRVLVGTADVVLEEVQAAFVTPEVDVGVVLAILWGILVILTVLGGGRKVGGH